MTDEIIIHGGWTPAEQDELNTHLNIINHSFITMIRSLAYIHKHRLYRGDDGLRTWRDFCKSELKMSERYGYYYIEAFSVLSEIETYNATTDTPLPEPTHLQQTRALAQTDNIVAVWQSVTSRYDNPTGKQIKSAIADVTIEQVLIMKGVTDTDVITRLATLYHKSDTGHEIVTEIVTTGYLQTGDEDEAIPLQQVRVSDLARHEKAIRQEAIMRRIADDGGVVITVYPSNPTKTIKALRSVMTGEQLYTLLTDMQYDKLCASLTGYDEV